MGELQEYRLDEVAEVIDCEHKTAPRVEQSAFYSVRTPDILNGRINYDSCYRVDEETYQLWTRRGRPEAGDIILAREAPVGEVGLIQPGYNVCLGQRTVLIKVKQELVNSGYLTYYLCAPPIKQELREQSGGSVVAHLNMKDIRAFRVSLPDLPEQRAIASVLSSLDAKIDLLHRQNKTLEAMAETLFRQWFVEEAEEGWEEVRLGDYIGTNERSLTKDTPLTSIKYLDTGAITKGHIEGLQELALKDAPSRARRLVWHNDIVYSTVRPIHCHYGLMKGPPDDLVVSTGFCVVTAKTLGPHFVYYLLTTPDMTEYLHSVAEGSTSTYPSLKPSDIEAVEFQLPPTKRMAEFESIASANWDRISNNYRQIKSLTALRDTLLPKLMSGEVRVEKTMTWTIA